MKTEKIPYAQLKQDYQSKAIPYARLLQTNEWYEKREEIVERDGCVCMKCKTQETEIVGIGKDEQGETRYYFIIKKKNNDGTFRNVVVRSPKGEVHFEVHHKYCVAGKLPWEYPEEALVTLCNWCHQKVHDTTVVPYYSHEGESLGYTPCQRCSGSGSFPEYSHVQAGVCFGCGGARYEELIGKQGD